MTSKMDGSAAKSRDHHDNRDDVVEEDDKRRGHHRSAREKRDRSPVRVRDESRSSAVDVDAGDRKRVRVSDREERREEVDEGRSGIKDEKKVAMDVMRGKHESEDGVKEETDVEGVEGNNKPYEGGIEVGMNPCYILRNLNFMKVSCCNLFSNLYLKHYHLVVTCLLIF